MYLFIIIYSFISPTFGLLWHISAQLSRTNILIGTIQLSTFKELVLVNLTMQTIS